MDQLLHVVLYSFPSTKVTDRARGEMGGQLLHDPLLHSVPSERKTDRARREMKGWTSSYM